MLYALSWSVVALLFAAWSFAVWALHALGTWVLTRVSGRDTGEVSGGALPALPDWLMAWVPAEWAQGLQSGLALLGPLAQQLLEAMPAVAGALTLAAWVVWALGAVVLAILGAALHGLAALWRRERAVSVAGSARSLISA